jgi:CelD/BcsL family acetyltransferase involved in cellulose biosynthesis
MIECAVDSREWLEFLAGRADAGVFHQPAWPLLLAECYGFRPFAIALSEQDGDRLVAGLPVLEITQLRKTRWVSQPFTDASPPLASESDAPRLLAEAGEAVRDAGARQLEIRGAFPGIPPGAAPTALSHVVALAEDQELVLAEVSRHVRKNLRASERAGLIVRRAERESDLAETFYALQLETRRRLGVPIQPRRWYRLLWRRFLEPGHGFLLLAYDRDRPVAGGVFLTWEQTITAKYSASTEAAWSLRPNNCVFWEAMRWGCANGYRTFDFGRTDIDAEGLRRFKLSWGAVEHPLHYTIIGETTRRADGSHLQFMSAVIRRSPPIVTRALGEILYRYAA